MSRDTIAGVKDESAPISGARRRWRGAVLAGIATVTLLATGFATGAWWRDYTRQVPAVTAPVGLHGVDWRRVSVPGSLCGIPGDVELRDGDAIVAGGRWVQEGVPEVEVSLYGPTVYGDLDGDGVDEATVGVWCAIPNGTAASQLAQGLVVFRLGTKGPEVVGTITTNQPQTSNVHVAYIDNDVTTIESGHIRVVELWYGPKDADCCASGRAETNWMYFDGKLARGETTVIVPTS